MYSVTMRGGRKRHKSQFQKGKDGKRKGYKQSWEKRTNRCERVVTRSQKNGNYYVSEGAMQSSGELNLSDCNSLLEQYQKADVPGCDLDIYKFLHAGKTCKLFTEAFHEHLEQYPNSYGNFEFDPELEKK